MPSLKFSKWSRLAAICTVVFVVVSVVVIVHQLLFMEGSVGGFHKGVIFKSNVVGKVLLGGVEISSNSSNYVNISNVSICKTLARHGIPYNICKKLTRVAEEFVYRYRGSASFRKSVLDVILNSSVVREFVDGRKVGKCFTIFQQIVDEIEKYKYPLSLMNCVEYYPPTEYSIVYNKATGTAKVYAVAKLMTVFANNQKVPKIVKEEYGKMLREYPYITCILYIYLNPGSSKIEKYSLECIPMFPAALYPGPGMKIGGSNNCNFHLYNSCTCACSSNSSSINISLQKIIQEKDLVSKHLVKSLTY